jgi:hypothetical protein
MDPRPRNAVDRLKGADFTIALQSQRDLIEASEQPGAAARVNLETMSLPGRRGDGLLLEIDADTSRTLGEFDLCGKTVGN